MAILRFTSGTNISDGLRVGYFADPVSARGAIGASTSPMLVYTVADAAPLNTSSLALAAVIPGGGGLLTLNYGSQGGTAPIVINGTRYIQLDFPRNVIVTISAANTTQDSILTINGLDYNQLPMTETLTIPTGTTNGTTLYANKAFAYIRSINASTTTGGGSQVAVGTGVTFGLPYTVTNGNHVQIKPLNGNTAKPWYEGVATLAAGTATVLSPYSPTVAAGVVTPNTGLTPIITPINAAAGETLTLTTGTASESFIVTSSDNTSTASFYWRMPVSDKTAIPINGGGTQTINPSGYVTMGAATQIIRSSFVTAHSVINVSYVAGGTAPATALYVNAVTASTTTVPGSFTINGTSGSIVAWEIVNPYTAGIIANQAISSTLIVADQSKQLNPANNTYYSYANAGDVRGTVTITNTLGIDTQPIPSFEVWMYVYGADGNYLSESAQTQELMYGVTQYYNPAYF